MSSNPLSVMRTLDIYESLQRRAEEIQNEMRLILDRFSEQLTLISDSLTDDQRTALTRNLYWNYPDVPVTALAPITGGGVRKVATLAGPMTVDCPCPVCGEVVERTVASRTELQTLQQYLRSKHRSFFLLCQTCKQLKEQEYSKRLEGKRWTDDLLAARVEDLRSMPYQEYLGTMEWKERREKALKRSGYRCQLCNGKSSLNVHHRTYERRGEEWDSDLIVLCRECHAKFHGVDEE